MTYTEAGDTHTGFLPWNLPSTMHSNSGVPSEKFPIALGNEHVLEDMVYKSSQSWADRLMDILCAMFSREKGIKLNQRYVESMSESNDGSSLWILPVYVLSTHQDKDKHHISLEAKCTIDTGNMQGNIVSRKFVEEVLGYPESAFCPLTKEEEVGATGITGHQLIPECAVYLTWYHKKSTRIFRNMRFLVSPNEMCDLIIGAQSIQKHKVLDVPNLMATFATVDKVAVTQDPITAPDADALNVQAEIEEHISALTTDILQKEKRKPQTPKLVEYIQDKKNQRAEFMKLQEAKSMGADEKKTEFEKLKTRFEVKPAPKGPPPAYQDSQAIPATSAPHGTGYQSPNSAQNANQGKKRGDSKN
ncbi:hypothetical protein BGZ60DRAFT_285843 [Tricladium varicosporioides]|nr:hypothetical protein BGZ60DRAFT_285843 [Hymenoscyphus varicosporioides]